MWYRIAAKWLGYNRDVDRGFVRLGTNVKFMSLKKDRVTLYILRHVYWNSDDSAGGIWTT